MRLYGFEVKDKTAFALSGKKRTAYEKGEKILVSEQDKLMLLKLGHKLIDEKDVQFEDVFGKKKSKKELEAEAKAQEEAEALEKAIIEAEEAEKLAQEEAEKAEAEAKA